MFSRLLTLFCLLTALPAAAGFLLAGCGSGQGPVKEIHLGEHHGNALQVGIELETTDSAVVRIRYWPDSLGERSGHESETSAWGLHHELLLFNLIPGAKYSYRVLVEKNGTGTQTAVFPFTTPALPFWLRNQFKATGDSTGTLPAVFRNGFMLLNKRETPGVAYIVDYTGRLRWYHVVSGTGFKVAHLTDSGTVLSILGKNDEPTSYGSEILEVNLRGDTLTYLKKGTRDFRFTVHHEILKDNRGHLVTIYVDQRLVDLRSVGGGAKDTVNGDGIVIMDTAGRKIWQWSIFDVTDPLKDPQILTTRRDWGHANSLNYDKDGHFLLSFYNSGQIWKIDPFTGKVEWKLGKGGDIRLPVDCAFTQSHAVHINRQGNLMFFDNGVENRLSEVFALRLDERNRSAATDLHIKLPPDIYNDRMGSAYMVTDSAILCCSSKRKITVLVDRKGVLLWDMETAIPPYRVEFIPGERMAVLQNEKVKQ